jgi:hypothetical protein
LLNALILSEMKKLEKKAFRLVAYTSQWVGLSSRKIHWLCHAEFSSGHPFDFIVCACFQAWLVLYMPVRIENMAFSFCTYLRRFKSCLFLRLFLNDCRLTTLKVFCLSKRRKLLWISKTCIQSLLFCSRASCA